MSGHPPVRILAGGRDVTGLLAGQMRFSNVDPGGYESLDVDLLSGLQLIREAPVRVLAGTETVWFGRFEEGGGGSEYGRPKTRLDAVGYGVALKENDLAAIFVDSELAAWKGPSTSRLAVMSSQGWQPGSVDVSRDNASGRPSLSVALQAPWTNRAQAEAYYDAGAHCRVGGLYYDYLVSSIYLNPALPDWGLQFYSHLDDALTFYDFAGTGSYEQTADLFGGGSSSGAGYWWTSGKRRVVGLYYAYLSAVSGVDYRYDTALRDLTVYGDHGLPLRGPAPGGLWPSDIVRYCLTAPIREGVIVNSDSYVTRQAAYRDPVPREQIIEDMRKLTAWHWGVWGPDGLFDDAPRLDFCPPPAQPTCSVSRSMCEDVDITESVSAMYDRARVPYRTADGSSGTVLVELAHPRMPDGLHRTLAVADMGAGSEAAARVVGQMVLTLKQRDGAAGSVTLPAFVRDETGGLRPACTLRAGRDRLRVVDLPAFGGLLEGDTRRYDTFRIRRVETTVTRDGRTRTRVEVDAGADLTETMQARLAAATGAAGG